MGKLLWLSTIFFLSEVPPLSLSIHHCNTCIWFTKTAPCRPFFFWVLVLVAWKPWVNAFNFIFSSCHVVCAIGMKDTVELSQKHPCAWIRIIFCAITVFMQMKYIRNKFRSKFHEFYLKMCSILSDVVLLLHNSRERLRYLFYWGRSNSSSEFSLSHLFSSSH